MTTREESLRSWTWGKKLLSELTLDMAQPREVRDAAAHLAARYPSELQLKEAAEGGWAANFNFHPALPAARDLFRRLGNAASTPTSLRHRLHVILRHIE
ncbi:BPSL0761 family protein [Rhizobacter sp. LjRoot28]|uniref:BPSL0761 family protein n=1 Tax=Rhizobacter sp. LjRoot28 TaxID=3342309 RepID=UPI003ECFFF88